MKFNKNKTNKVKRPLDGFKGKVKYRMKKNGNEGNFESWKPFSHNLFVDDGKELTLDILFGLMSWWNPQDEGDYSGGDSGWDTVRYVGPGISMFHTASFERASGIVGIPSGDEYDYKIADTYLVSPEDSYLSNEVGSRVVLSKTRRDQTVEFTANFNAPGDMATGINLRELGVFLRASGPMADPSLHEDSKKYAMICRSVRYGTGYYNSLGATGQQGQAGYEPCYTDDPILITGDLELQWIFGEL